MIIFHFDQAEIGSSTASTVAARGAFQKNRNRLHVANFNWEVVDRLQNVSFLD